MLKWMSAVVVVGVLAGCAKPKPVGDLNLSATVTIQIDNNYMPPDQVQVYIANQNGGQYLLGSVSPGRSVKFTYAPTNATDKFALIAQGTGGAKRSSQIFSLLNLTSLRWDLKTNTVVFYEP